MSFGMSSGCRRGRIPRSPAGRGRSRGSSRRAVRAAAAGGSRTNGQLPRLRLTATLIFMTRYLFSSHDGFGVGHVRRNTLIARAVLVREPDAEIGIITGLAVRTPWLRDPRMHVLHVPELVKNSNGSYRNDALSFEEALERRADVFSRTVTAFAPDVVVVDRHPYGICGELHDGLDRAGRLGAALVLGLRDILDEPVRVAQELAGAGWAGVADMYD